MQNSTEEDIFQLLKVKMPQIVVILTFGPRRDTTCLWGFHKLKHKPAASIAEIS